jgi:hypothetical protein
VAGATAHRRSGQSKSAVRIAARPGVRTLSTVWLGLGRRVPERGIVGCNIGGSGILGGGFIRLRRRGIYRILVGSIIVGWLLRTRVKAQGDSDDRTD